MVTEKKAEVKEEVSKVDKMAEELKAKRAEQKQECLDKTAAILKSFDGLESNIPVSSEYWGLMNQYRGL